MHSSTAMKAICGWTLIFWHTCILAAISAKSVKLGPPIDPEIFPSTTTTTTTTLAPTVTPTTHLIEVNNNTTSDDNSSAINNTSVYDHKHKILLLILSDLNVRGVRDPQQQGKQHSILLKKYKKTIKASKKFKARC